MRRIINFFIILCFSLLVINVYAQEFKVKGKITASDGLGLPGVSVVVKGTLNGAISDEDGNYTINANRGATLQFISIGSETQEVIVNRDVIDVVMKESATSLSEVVVTGLGVRREVKSLGYAMSSIKSEDLLKAGVTANPLSSLYGKAAGVGISQSASGPTGSVNIKVRGAARLESSSKTRPLFVVDGVPIYDQESSMAVRGYDPMNSFDYGSGINDINPEDIESMEILKGAKASVLYGSEGANGVVLITTKKGAGTRGLGVQLSYNHTFEKPINYIDFQNEFGTGTSQYSEELVDLNGKSVRKLVNTRYSFGPKFDGQPIMDVDGRMIPYEAQENNFNDLFRTGHTNNLTVAVTGGNEKGSMRASYTNYKYDGILDNFWQKKNTVSFSGRMNVSKFANFEVNTNLFNVSTHNRLPNMNQLMSFGLNRDYPLETLQRYHKTEDGFKRDLEGFNYAPFASNVMGLLWHQGQNSNTDDKLHLIGSIKANFQLLPYLSLVGLAGVDYTNTQYTRKDRVQRITPEVVGGKYGFSLENYFIQNYEGSLNFDKTFLGQMRVFTMLGGSYRSNRRYDIGVATFGDMPYPDWYSLNNENSWPGVTDREKVRTHTRGSDVLYSAYGATTISWSDTYYIDISARNDWASTLPAGNNSYLYPGVSFTWNFTNNFSIPLVEYGKLRAAWADVGTPASRYFALNNYSVSSIAGTDAVSVTPPESLMAGKLRPERKREFEAGLNLKIFPKSRLEVDFSFYTNNIYDQIMSVPLSASTSYSQIKINAGKVKNWGYELLLKVSPISNEKYRWDITLTTANQYSKVLSLYPGITRKTIETGGSGGFLVVADVGERMGDLLTYDYMKDNKGNRVIGSDGLYKMDQSAYVRNSNVNPKFIGGAATDFFFKGFNFHVGLDYKFGGSIASMSNYYLLGNGVVKETLQYRNEELGGMAYYINNQNNKIKWQHGQAAPPESKNGLVYHDGLILKGVREENGQFVENDQIISVYDYWSTFVHDMGGDLQPDYIFKNDYIKLREVAFSYTLPKKISEQLRLQKLTFTVNARNLFYLYKTLPNVDAESNLGSNTTMEYTLVPSIRTIGFGVNVSF